MDLIKAVSTSPKTVKDLSQELNVKFTDIVKEIHRLKATGEIVVVNGKVAIPGCEYVTEAIDNGGVMVDGQIKTTIDVEPGSAPKSKRGRKTSSNSKTVVARRIYDEMVGKSRKEVLERFITEAQLTPAGASTYYANFKKLTANS